MSRAQASRGSAYCQGTNKDGKPCGNKVPTLPSGVYIRRYCHVHSRVNLSLDNYISRGGR